MFRNPITINFEVFMNHLYITETISSHHIDESTKEALPFNKINYTAIEVLDWLGINAPSQEQIDILETVLTFLNSDVIVNLPNSQNHHNFHLIAKQFSQINLLRQNINVCQDN